MKILLIILILVPFLLSAQTKIDDSKTLNNEQLKNAMVQISSSSLNRETMLKMILDKSKDSKEEMTGLGKIIMDNPGMNAIVTGMTLRKAKAVELILTPGKMMKDSTKKMEMSGYKKDPGK